jgi:hypothetical protein
MYAVAMKEMHTERRVICDHMWRSLQQQPKKFHSQPSACIHGDCSVAHFFRPYMSVFCWAAQHWLISLLQLSKKCLQTFIHKRPHSRQTGNKFKYTVQNAMMLWCHPAHLFPALDSLHYKLWIIQTKWYNLINVKQESVFQKCKEHRKKGNLAAHTFLPLPIGTVLCASLFHAKLCQLVNVAHLIPTVHIQSFCCYSSHHGISIIFCVASSPLFMYLAHTVKWQSAEYLPITLACNYVTSNHILLNIVHSHAPIITRWWITN